MNYVPEEHALRVGEQAKAGGNRHRQLARALAIGTIAVLVLLSPSEPLATIGVPPPPLPCWKRAIL